MLLNTDSNPKDDFLDRRLFAVQIAKGLLKVAEVEHEGFVTALTGKWGSGKSTMLSYIKEEFALLFKKQTDDFSILSFDAWMFTDKENIKQSFLKIFASHLKGKNGYCEKKRLLFVADKLNLLKVFGSAAGTAGEQIGKLLQSYLDTSDSMELKNQINQNLIKYNRKIFIFIDEMERLNPKQIFDVFQVLKLVANFKNTYYIIAYDREAIELSIETQFKGYGKKYIDKIVQADFFIPDAPDEKVEALFFQQLERICTDYQINYNSSTLSSVWLHHGMRRYFSTIRDVYRYMNALQFSLPVIPEDIDITDFLILQAIRLHDFDTYQKLYEDISQSNNVLGSAINFSSQQYQLQIANTTTRKLVSYLFPDNLIAAMYGEHTSRLQDPKYSERYFTLKVASKDITEVEFRRVMTAGSNRLELLAGILKFGRLDNLLIRLNDSSLHKHYSTWNFTLIEDLFQFFNLYARDIDSHYHRLADAIINLLTIRRKEQEDYFTRFNDLLLEPTKNVEYARLYFLHYMIGSKDHDNGFPGNAYDFKEFYLERYDKLKTYYLAYLKTMESYFLSETIRDPLGTFTGIFVFSYATYLPKDYKTKVSELLHKDPNLLFYLKNILWISSDEQANRIDGSKLETLLPGEENKLLFLETLKNMDISIFLQGQAQWREFILEHFKDLDKK